MIPLGGSPRPLRRTPLEVALDARLALDFDDLDLGDYDAQDAADAAAEAARQLHAEEAGEFLYRQAVRDRVPTSFRGGRL